MREKSKSWVTDLTLADPNTTEGITEIMKLYTKYQPVISTCGTVRAKGAVNGEHCTTLHCTALHYTALHCTALHCTALHCTALHCTALHCLGDQAFLERASSVIFDRSNEDSAEERLSPCVPVPQEFHALKVL